VGIRQIEKHLATRGSGITMAGVMKEGFYDPVERAAGIEASVCKDELRKYYRFRPARFYGGIATADCLGCCLRCLFCWSWDNVVKADQRGEFHSPEQVARKLVTIARKRRFQQVRISGNEPTIGKKHLIGVLKALPRDVLFILETNGILIGYDNSYAEELAHFENLYVRVSLKGATEQEFVTLTGAKSEGFGLQLKALENLHGAGVDTQPAVMVSFSTPKNLSSLRKRLGWISKHFENFETEELVLYGDVEDRLRRAKIDFDVAHRPECVPAEQV
jgi:uncharacterized Fe-S cluster-containing radical SAM superfamily protein